MVTRVSSVSTHDRPTLDASQVRTSSRVRDMLQDCEEIAQTAPGDIHRIGSLLQEMILKYYADVRSQAQQSFRAALAAATVGILFFIYAIWLGMSPDGSGQARLGLIAGSLIQFISGINFYLYFRAGRQFASFHVCLERTNRFLLANTICENLSDPARDEMRRELVRVVATAPMLTLDVVTGDQRLRRARKEPTGRPNKPLQPTSIQTHT